MQDTRTQEPSVDAMLAELAAEGNAQAAPPLPPPVAQELLPAAPEQGEGEVCEAYVRMKQRVMARAGGSGEGGLWTSKDGIKRVRYSHQDCIDRILMTPSITQTELAQIYGVTDAWMTIVVNSDAFKVQLAERRQELIDPALLVSLNERYGALATKSVEVLLEKLAKPADQISDRLAIEAAQLGAKAMGLGQPQVAPSGATAVDHLALLAHRLVDLNRPPAQIIEAETRNP